MHKKIQKPQFFLFPPMLVQPNLLKTHILPNISCQHLGFVKILNIMKDHFIFHLKCYVAIIHHFYFLIGLRQQQAVLQHSDHQKQLWIIRVQLSWPYAEALETWSSGTSLWVHQDTSNTFLRRAFLEPRRWRSGQETVVEVAAPTELWHFCHFSVKLNRSCFYLLACTVA